MDPAALSLIGTIIAWIFFLIIFGMLKSYISYGVNIAVGEFLMGPGKDTTTREKVCRWFANGHEIEAYLQDIDEKMDREKKK